ncbi:MAG: RND family transporter [Mycobacterium sp.]|nr:RND family transporter [Mycobacterium sp.]
MGRRLPAENGLPAEEGLPAGKSPTGESSRLFAQVGAFVVRWPWLVIALWIGLAVGLTQVFPPLSVLAQRAPAAILPADAPSTVAQKQMAEAFKEAGSDNILLVVLTNDKGFTPADEGVYRDLAKALRADSEDVLALQDFVTTPPLREVLVSKDSKAWLMPVSLAGEIGTPQATDATKHALEIVREKTAGQPMEVYTTGPAATFNDLQDIGERDRMTIEIATVVALLTILLMVYRNPLTMILPLITIGVSLVTAQGVVAGMGTAGLSVSMQTIVLLTAMLSGAGTDYAVFLISRYHDFLRAGADSDTAIRDAMESVGKVIAASAATVAVTFMGMVFTKLTVFSTVGIALAAAIAVGCLGALTFLPALLVLAGRRGWVKPRRDLTGRFWKRSGIRIVRHPKVNLLVSLVILAALASTSALAHYNYDDRKVLPAASASIEGYDAISRHFPLNASLPQYILITSPHDLRTPQALADMEEMAQRVSQLPDMDLVRGITRPTGERLEQGKLSFQAGEVGSKIGEASNLINSNTSQLNLLASGANQIADVLGSIRSQMGQAIATVSGLVQSLVAMQNQFGGNQTLQQFDQANKLLDAMHALGATLGMSVSDAIAAFGQNVDPVLNALGTSPVCDSDPNCVAARSQLEQAAAARDNGLLAVIAELGRQLEAVRGNQTLGATADNLNAALNSVTQTLHAAGLNSPADLQAQLSQLELGVNTLADASRQVADGVQLLVDQTKKLGSGLDQASTFLLMMKHDAKTPSMAGFYVPPQILTSDEFKKAAAVFFSADGHTARYLVQSKLNPFNPEAMDQVNDILATARGAQPNTSLADASISMSGLTVTLRDTRDYYREDLRLIVTATILVVLGILILLLRALVAPLYLIGSVVISYLSALGMGVAVFQYGLGKDLHWSVPGLTFIILVAVGADYNLLLISRIRDESPYGIRSGVIRTVSQTGGVITAAGLIFAASMIGLQFSSIATLAQIGFVIGAGILLDTFLVRTVTVPAMAVLVGKANWWPSKWQPPAPTRRAPKPEPETEAPGTDSPDTETSETETSETGARETEAPGTDSPDTEPPGTEPPDTDATGTSGSAE